VTRGGWLAVVAALAAYSESPTATCYVDSVGESAPEIGAFEHGC
jgi:hypothetical protein